jgi:hypothetical protein
MLGFGLMLAGCASSVPPAPTFPELSFSQQPSFRFNVARAEILMNYHSNSQAPHIEYDMPVSPENAIRRWVRDRVSPVGTMGTMRIVVTNASATETPLKTDQSVAGLFTKQQAAQIDMAVNVSIQMLDDHQFVIAEASAQATRSRTLPEGITLNERDQILYDMVKDMMAEFDTAISPKIQDTLGRWLQL